MELRFYNEANDDDATVGGGAEEVDSWTLGGGGGLPIIMMDDMDDELVVVVIEEVVTTNGWFLNMAAIAGADLMLLGWIFFFFNLHDVDATWTPYVHHVAWQAGKLMAPR